MDKSEGYRKKIIKQLYFEQALSCAALSKHLNKSLPLTAKILAEHIEQGLIVEKGYAPSTGGRRAVTFALNQDILYLVSVAMDQFVSRMVIMDIYNKPITRIETLPLPLKNNKKAIPLITDTIIRLIAESGIPKEKIAGIGLGMPGFIDADKGHNHSYLEAPKTSITGYIKDRTGLPVFIDNDSSLIALAEQHFGKAKGRGTVMVINIGWGIGLGMLINGHLFRGDTGLAGELSHIPLFSNNKLCSCGKSGCLETETSLLMMAEKALDGLKEGRLSAIKQLPHTDIEETINAIISEASNGDRFAVELLSEAGYNIGRGAAILIHLLNPKLIILSGRGSLAGRLWLPPIQQAINEHCIPKIAENTEIEVSSLGYEAELIGAAALIMENLDSVKPAKTNRKTFQPSIYEP